MEAQVAALEDFVKDLRQGLNEHPNTLLVAQQAAALELCVMLYRLIMRLV